MADKNVPTIHDQLMSNRTVILEGKITRQQCNTVLNRLLALQFDSPTEAVKLVINSGGGDSDAALDLCDFIDHVLTVPIHAIVIGECSSSATLILLSCTTKSATRHSRFVIHSGTLGGVEFTTDNMTNKKLADLTREATNYVQMVKEYYARKLGVGDNIVEKLLARGDQTFDNALSAEEALQVGLITDIIEGKLDIFPKPT
jgi:ATP-dependent protease ClpP protease subunit